MSDARKVQGLAKEMEFHRRGLDSSLLHDRDIDIPSETVKMARFVLARESALRENAKRLEQELERVKKELDYILLLNRHGKINLQDNEISAIKEALAPKEKP